MILYSTGESNQVSGPMGLYVGQNKVLADIGQENRNMTPELPYFRPGTEIAKTRSGFVFAGAGIGDFICYMPAMIWLARNCPWIEGRIHAPKFFLDFAENIMHDFPAWKFYPSEMLGQIIDKNQGLTGPGLSIHSTDKEGKPIIVKYQQLANGTGGHLVDVGFLYFCNLFPVPNGADVYPQINFDRVPSSSVCDLAESTSGRYVVFTPGGVSPARTVPGAYWNPIIDHVLSLGLMPVFLGKTELSKDLKVKFPDGCAYDKGLDLRDKTTLLEAAYIMKNAAVTIGLDNGLIQLASCTDASIVCAYNIVAARERRPNRPNGKWLELEVSRAELACTGCQTNMKRLYPHNFTGCLYGDTACIDILFGNDGFRWKQAINNIIGIC